MSKYVIEVLDDFEFESILEELIRDEVVKVLAIDPPNLSWSSKGKLKNFDEWSDDDQEDDGQDVEDDEEW